MRCVRRSVMVLTMFAGLVAARTAAAQAPAAPPPPPAREGSLEFALLATSGNTSTRTLGLGGDVTFRPGKWVYLAKAAYVQNEVEGVLAARSFATSFRASREVRKNVSLFGRVAYLHDRFSGIESRTVVEGGVAGTWTKGRQTFSADGSLGYANEQRTAPPDASNGVASASVRYRIQLSETSDFTDDLRYTQSLSTGADYRLDQIAALTAKLTTLFSLKASYTVRYVNTPVPTFKTTDTVTAIALVAKF